MDSNGKVINGRAFSAPTEVFAKVVMDGNKKGHD
jgi:hypothetical protein